MSGLFISFEGGEGCGKSTQIAALRARLESKGNFVVETREPGGTELGESIRRLLQREESEGGILPETELLLFAASRAQHVRELIAPALARGEIVLCDRFMDSTTVYQGMARAINGDAISAINRIAIGSTQPDYTILIDLPPDVGFARIRSRSQGQLDRIEQETLEFFKMVRQGYLDLAKKEPDRFIVINGGHSTELVRNNIWDALATRLSW